jgi:hypothetical protein
MRLTPNWRERVDEIVVTGSDRRGRAAGEPIAEVMTLA